jgi:hypothetical protein
MTQVEAYRALKPITSGTAFTSGQWGEGEEPNTGVRAILDVTLRLDSSPNVINAPLAGLALIHFIP